MSTQALDTFTTAYLECALWASTDNSNDQGGEPLNYNYGIDDFDPSAIAQALADCAQFRELAGDMLADWTDEQAGHDFWLTRNGHGAGFWDRDMPHGDELTDIAHSFGSCDAYVGDDNLIYLS